MHALFLTPTCLLAYIAPVSNTHATRLLSLQQSLSHYHFIAQYYRPIELRFRGPILELEIQLVFCVDLIC